MLRDQGKTLYAAAALVLVLSAGAGLRAGQAATVPKPVANVTGGLLTGAAGALTKANPVVANTSPQLLTAFTGVTNAVAVTGSQVTTQGLQVNPLQGVYSAIGGQGTTPVSLNTFANTKIGATTVTGNNPNGLSAIGLAVGSPTLTTEGLVNVGVLSAGKPISVTRAGLH